MKFGVIDFDQEILQALRNNKLAIFAGAGVSMGAPSNLPSFGQLVADIAQEASQHAVEPWDRFLGELQQKGIKVHTLAVSLLKDAGSIPNQLHIDLLRVFHQIGNVRIIITNYPLFAYKHSTICNLFQEIECGFATRQQLFD